jgi:iron-sulfur cluster assembly protein
MIAISEDARAALESMQARRAGGLVRLSASQVCDCGKIGFKLGWADEPQAGDLEERKGRLTFIYDPGSQLYLDGVEVDYQDELMGKSFSFFNPNLKNGGGCGREFE